MWSHQMWTMYITRAKQKHKCYFIAGLKPEIKQEEEIIFFPVMHFTVSFTTKRIYQFLVSTKKSDWIDSHLKSC